MTKKKMSTLASNYVGTGVFTKDCEFSAKINVALVEAIQARQGSDSLRMVQAKRAFNELAVDSPQVIRNLLVEVAFANGALVEIFKSLTEAVGEGDTEKAIFAQTILGVHQIKVAQHNAWIQNQLGIAGPVIEVDS